MNACDTKSLKLFLSFLMCITYIIIYEIYRKALLD